MCHFKNILMSKKVCFKVILFLLAQQSIAGTSTSAMEQVSHTVTPSPSPSMSPCPSPSISPTVAPSASKAPTPSVTPSSIPSSSPCISPTPGPNGEKSTVPSFPCRGIHGGLFVSGPKEGGLGPEEPTQAPWQLKFDGGRVTWSHGDVIEKGRYECRNTELFITIADQKQKVSFSDSIVIFQNEEYKRKANK